MDSSSNYLCDRRKLGTVIKVISALGIFHMTPAIGIHHVFLFMAGTVRSHLKRNIKVQKIQKQTWDWRGCECTMHVNVQHSPLSPLSTVAASGRTRLTSLRLIFFFFILSLATIPSNHSSLQIILFFKLVMYFCALRQSTKSRFGKFLSISFPDPNLLLQTYINLIY